MTLPNECVELLNKIIEDEKKCIKILNYINKLESKGLIDNNKSFFLVKVFIIILSYYPDKTNKIIKLMKIFYKSKSDSKNNLVKLINKFDVLYYEENFLNDYLMDDLIFNTFDFLLNSLKYSKCLVIDLINEILLNTTKIKTNNKELKLKIYLMYLKNSNKILINSKDENSKIYLKVIESCGVTTKVINNFLN